MAQRRQHMERIFNQPAAGAAAAPVESLRVDRPREVRHTLIDFATLKLPADVSHALADAFWNHIGIREDRSILTAWSYLKVFGRFAAETAVPTRLVDVNRALLARYVEWLNAQQRASGEPWTKATRSCAYTTLRKLLQWIERCRPGVLGAMEYPFNPFPWRNRDTQPNRKLPAARLRAILKACERDISATRARRAEGDVARADSAYRGGGDPASSLGALLGAIEARYAGIIPTWKALYRAGDRSVLRGLKRFGGARQIAPLLYPDANSILPYYLALLIHTAGNPDPIAALATDCLQPIPLLDDRQI